MEANLRNTKIKIARSFLENNYTKDRSFTEKELSKRLWIRKKEIEAFKDKLFDERDGKFSLKESFYNEVSKWIQEHDANKENIEEVKEKYKALFEKFSKSYNYSEYMRGLKPLYTHLHWYFLPVYRDYMIDNRGVSPEDDIDEYYDHFHSLQDLYNLIDKDQDYWKTLKGDLNLGVPYKFPVYTNRWGHEDIYAVTRTYDGWYVKYHGIGGECKPDGKGRDSEFDGRTISSPGGFIENFNQDYVDYPKNFHYVIERLWNLADENEMNPDELQEKLLDVAKLVSEVERTVGRFTPSWY